MSVSITNRNEALELALPRIGTQCYRLYQMYRALHRRGQWVSDRQMENIMGWRTNIVTGRRNDLVEAGLVIDRGTEYGRTLWGLSDKAIKREN